MKAKKSLGQNFLIDQNIINKIINEISANKNDLIIEIGPGKGALTKKLKEKNCSIIAYELDKDLQIYLDKLQENNLNIIYQDFLKTNIQEDIKEINYKKLYIVGNLPYYITTPIIEHIIKSNINFEKLVIMVQLEVANRFTAKPKTKDYGYITLLLNYYFNINKVCNVSKNSFNPIPKVESAVISFTPKTKTYNIDTEKYFNFLKEAFKQKRKTLKNNLEKYEWEKIEQILTKHNLPMTTRAEELTQEIFIEIFNNL